MIEPVEVQEQITAENENSEKGASLVEYALLVALIAVVAIVTVRLLGSTISQQFSAINSQLGG